MLDFFSGEHIYEYITNQEFTQLALEIFRFQAQENLIYSNYIKYLSVNPNNVRALEQIPFMPISFFKHHKILSRFYNLPDNKFIIFRSSGTTSMQRSTHYIYNIALYERSFFKAFEIFYGPIEQYIILALLPSYIERGDSSLIYMVKSLIEKTNDLRSGFYLYNYEDLYRLLLDLLLQNKKKVLLIGVSFALLEFARLYKLPKNDMIVMETGGMKGRGRELVREQLHEILTQAFGVKNIHSEYGMTELLSQAYSKEKGIFRLPPWMRIIIRDMNDPFYFLDKGSSGGINVIDLANVYSCAFIETKDIGVVYEDNSFSVLGRFDNADLRGCNLLVL